MSLRAGAGRWCEPDCTTSTALYVPAREQNSQVVRPTELHAPALGGTTSVAQALRQDFPSSMEPGAAGLTTQRRSLPVPSGMCRLGSGHRTLAHRLRVRAKRPREDQQRIARDVGSGRDSRDRSARLSRAEGEWPQGRRFKLTALACLAVAFSLALWFVSVGSAGGGIGTNEIPVLLSLLTAAATVLAVALKLISGGTRQDDGAACCRTLAVRGTWPRMYVQRCEALPL